MLYSPETGPGLEDLAPPDVDQVTHPQPEPQDRHRQHEGEGGRNAAGLQKYIRYGEMYKGQFCNIRHQLYSKIP